MPESGGHKRMQQDPRAEEQGVGNDVESLHLSPDKTKTGRLPS